MSSMKEQLEQSDKASYISSIRFRREKNKNIFRTYERHKATNKKHDTQNLKKSIFWHILLKPQNIKDIKEMSKSIQREHTDH